MLFSKKRVYMDYASSTPLDPRVKKAMKYASRFFGNPSAPHKEGRKASLLIEDARVRIGRALKARPETLLFTGSGTESNNLALVGFIEHLVRKGASYDSLHIIISSFEHPSVLEPIEDLERRGVAVSRLDPNENGAITPHGIAELITPHTALVSVALVQGEIGQIQPLRDIAHMLEEYKKKRSQKNQQYVPESSLPVLHTDASQAPLYVAVSPEHIGADMITYDAQKILGPKGVGLLYKHSSVSIDPVLRGGSQERTLRPGTQNTTGIYGMMVAFELAEKGRKERVERITMLRDYFLEHLKKELPTILVNGGVKNRVANNVHISIPGIDGDYLTVLLDKEGIAVSPRSACIASGQISHTVKVLGRGKEAAQGTIRFSFGPNITRAEVDFVLRALKRCITVQTFDKS